MMVQRLYDRGDPEPSKLAAPKLKVLHLGQRQKFSPGVVFDGVAAGYLTLAKGRLIIHGTVPGGPSRTPTDIVFRILRTPGLWCCHCGRRLASSAAAQRHVIDQHHGAPSPDSNNPSGYEQLNALDCERE